MTVQFSVFIPYVNFGMQSKVCKAKVEAQQAVSQHELWCATVLRVRRAAYHFPHSMNPSWRSLSTISYPKNAESCLNIAYIVSAL